ncbi:hypothetical protein KC19_VG078800 [Ceratodon purpureus]|uniref:Secreted protein n=1 Tax=Ceratodon purpureus TaxID=3225 RepID=A0A8T0HN31_CERPU|nr:hypothetical protein KC19_VG078800 [Ceratodon purpureus]
MSSALKPIPSSLRVSLVRTLLALRQLFQCCVTAHRCIGFDTNNGTSNATTLWRPRTSFQENGTCRLSHVVSSGFRTEEL